MNITLRDLLRWSASPLYTAASVSTSLADREAALVHPDRTVSWPVTMRATAPMLPHVEAGAIVLLSGATLAEVRPLLPGALHELRRRGVAALVIDPGEVLGMAVDDLDILRARGGVNPDLELALTRLINEHRAELYRRGTEIDRALTEATLRGRGVRDLLRIGVNESGHPLLLLDEHGQVQERSTPPGQSAPLRPPAPPLGVDAAVVPIADPLQGIEWLLAPLEEHAQGWLALAGQRGSLTEIDLLLVKRAAAACSLALSQARRSRPRLAPARRASTIAELLRPELSVEERQARGDLLGFDQETSFAVLALAPRLESADPARALLAARRTIAARVVPHGEVDDFTDEATGMTGAVIHTTRPEALSRIATSLRAGLSTGGRTAEVTAALSEPVDDLADLPAATRQVRYALAVLRTGALPASFVDWACVSDLGPYGLLYPLWGTPAAARFVTGILGDLPEHDTRYGGELLPTLLAYLRQGGAAGAAANDLAIHRNTLAYRLRRIEEICRRSPLDPDQHLGLHLAALLFSLPAADDH